MSVGEIERKKGKRKRFCRVIEYICKSMFIKCLVKLNWGILESIFIWKEDINVCYNGKMWKRYKGKKY